MTQNIKHTNLFNKKKITSYPVPLAHAPASVPLLFSLALSVALLFPLALISSSFFSHLLNAPMLHVCVCDSQILHERKKAKKIAIAKALHMYVVAAFRPLVTAQQFFSHFFPIANIFLFYQKCKSTGLQLYIFLISPSSFFYAGNSYSLLFWIWCKHISSLNHHICTSTTMSLPPTHLRLAAAAAFLALPVAAA